jgi:hypothetical protein
LYDIRVLVHNDIIGQREPITEIMLTNRN